MKTVEEMKKEKGLPVVIADQQGLITYVNKPFQEVFGWSADEIVGRALSTIIPKNLHDAHNLGFSRFITSGKPTLLNQTLKLKAVSKDGRVFDAEHFIVAEKQKERWLFAATILPVSRHGD